MKIVIVGPGAMGCLFAAFLLKAAKKNSDIDVWLLDKNPTRTKFIQQHGIKITGISKITIHRRKIKITTCAKQIGLADLIVLFVKSYDTKNAIKSVFPCISKDTAILTLQNGLNNLETIKHYLISQSINLSISNIFAGITSHGATSLGFGRVRHAGEGETVISSKMEHELQKESSLGRGAWSRSSCSGVWWKLKAIGQIFNSAGIKTKISDNLDGLLWSKLVINSAINPLGTITFRRNGELIENLYIKKLLCSIAEESAKVAKKLGIKLLYRNASKKVIEVCRKTAKNYNSMLQDIMNSKRTEIDYINGAIIRFAKTLTKPFETPLNNLLYYYLKRLEKCLRKS